MRTAAARRRRRPRPHRAHARAGTSPGTVPRTAKARAVNSIAPSALTGRRATENYGLGHKLATARYTPYSTTKMAAFVRQKINGQMEAPEVQKFLDDLTGQCILAIEEDLTRILQW